MVSVLHRKKNVFTFDNIRLKMFKFSFQTLSVKNHDQESLVNFVYHILTYIIIILATSTSTDTRY